MTPLMQRPTPEEEKNFERWLTYPNWDDHDFKEEYYGWKCSKCDLFFAYGYAPWEDTDAENATDEE